MRLRSLFVGTLVSMIAILAISFLVFQQISTRMQRIRIDPTFDRMDELQVQDARSAYETEGTKGLQEYMDRLDHIFKGKHYLLDASGKDLLSGEDFSSLLPPPPATRARTRSRGRWVIAHRSEDGKYWFTAVGPVGRIHVWTFLPYYFLVLGATAALFWLASVGVVLPILRIANSIARFGQGDLSVRVKTSRPDEIGQLGRSFNQMADRLQRLIVSERRLLGDISHELRSPLARLKFAVKLARTSSDTNAALDRIERDVNRIASLVSDIVEITFAEGDPALRGAEAVDVGQVVRDVVQDCSVEADIRGCRIHLNGNIGGQALGSRELLRRAFENVLRNAVRYSPDRTLIDVEVEERQGKCEIVVRDFGPGVPEEALVHIFESFYRVEEARDTNGGGSGLGLSIAKRAVEAHHGCISAENASPGLRVRMVIPLIQAAASVEELAAPPADC